MLFATRPFVSPRLSRGPPTTMLYELLAHNIPSALHLPHSWQVYEPGVTPLSTVKSVTLAMITYFIVIFSGRELMRFVRLFSSPPSTAHNSVCLIVFSLLSLLAFP